MQNDLVYKNIGDFHHLDNHQQGQELSLDHRFEIHRYLKNLYEILWELFHPKQSKIITLILY